MRKTIAVAAVLCLLVAAGTILAVGPVPSLDDEPEQSTDATPSPTRQAETATSATATDSMGTATGTDGAVSTPPRQADRLFDFTVDQVEECGESCRSVTAIVTNNRSVAASDVTVDLRLFAGNETGGDPIWSAAEPVGRLGAGESASVTRRVELSTENAFEISRYDGWVIVEATIRSENGTVTVTRRRNVL